MANDEALAALERAAFILRVRDHDIARIIRAHIETLRATGAEGDRNGGERAQIVAWLFKTETLKDAIGCTMVQSNADATVLVKWIMKAIQAGAHLKGEG